MRTPDPDRLRELVTGAGATAMDRDDGAVIVHALDAARVGELAAQHGLVLHELTPQRASLEEVFMDLTRDSVEFSGGLGGAA